MTKTSAISVQSIGSVIPGGVANTVLYLNGSSVLSANANLGWDGTTFVCNGGATFNSSLANVDFNISSDTITNFFHIDANGMAGPGSMGIGGPAYAAGGPLLWIYGEVWQFVAGNVRTLVGESSSFFGGFQWIDATNIFQMGNNTLDQFQVDASSNIVINEAGRSCDLRIEGDTDINCLIVDGSADRVGVGIAVPLGQFRVGYDAANSLSFSVGSTGIATVTSSGSASGIQLVDGDGVFLTSQSSDVILQNLTYTTFVRLNATVELNDNSGSIIMDGSGTITSLVTSGSYISLSNAIRLEDASFGYIELNAGTINIANTSGATYMFGLPTADPASTGALYYDNVTGIVYISL